MRPRVRHYLCLFLQVEDVDLLQLSLLVTMLGSVEIWRKRGIPLGRKR
jgi:hypothetical protein